MAVHWDTSDARYASPSSPEPCGGGYYLAVVADAELALLLGGRGRGRRAVPPVRRRDAPPSCPAQPVRAAPRTTALAFDVRPGGCAQHAVPVPGGRHGARGDGALPRRPAHVLVRDNRRGRGGGERGRADAGGGAPRRVELPREPHRGPRRRRRGGGHVGRARLVVLRLRRRGAVHGEGTRTWRRGVDGQGDGQQGPPAHRVLPPGGAATGSAAVGASAKAAPAPAAAMARSIWRRPRAYSRRRSMEGMVSLTSSCA